MGTSHGYDATACLPLTMEDRVVRAFGTKEDIARLEDTPRRGDDGPVGESVSGSDGAEVSR